MTDILEIKLDGVEQLVTATQSLSQTVESIAKLNAQLKDIYEKEHQRKVSLAEAQKVSREKSEEARAASQPERDKRRQELEDRRAERQLEKEKRERLKIEKEETKKQQEERKAYQTRYGYSLNKMAQLSSWQGNQTSIPGILSAWSRNQTNNQPVSGGDQSGGGEGSSSLLGNMGSAFARLGRVAGAVGGLLKETLFKSLKAFGSIIDRLTSLLSKGVLGVLGLTYKLASDMKQSSALGVDVQTPKFMEAAFGQKVDTKEMMMGIARMQQDPTSLFYNQMLKDRNLTGKESMDTLTIEAMKYIRSIGQRFEGNLGAAQKLYHFEDLVSPEVVRSLAHAPEGWIEQREKAYGENRREVGFGAEQNIADFEMRMKFSLLKFETWLAQTLVPALEPLKGLGDSLVKLFAELNGEKAVKGFLHMITTATESLAAWFGRKDIQEGLDRWAKFIYDVLEPATTVLGNALAKLAEYIVKLDPNRLLSTLKEAPPITEQYGNELKYLYESMEKPLDEWLKGVVKGTWMEKPFIAEKTSFSQQGSKSDDMGMLVKVLASIANQRKDGIKIDFGTAQSSSNMLIQVNRVPGAAGGAPQWGNGQSAIIV